MMASVMDSGERVNSEVVFSSGRNAENRIHSCYGEKLVNHTGDFLDSQRTAFGSQFFVKHQQSADACTADILDIGKIQYEFLNIRDIQLPKAMIQGFGALLIDNAVYFETNAISFRLNV